MAVFKAIENFLKKSVYTGPLAKEKSTRAPGSKEYKPTDTSGKKFKPAYMKTVKPKTSGKIAKGNGNPYTPTQLKPVGPDMGRDAHKPRSKGNSVPGKKAITKTRTEPGRVTERQDGYTLNYRDGPNYKSKKKETQAPKKKSNKRFRAGPTMTGMGGMRQSGTLRGKYVK